MVYSFPARIEVDDKLTWISDTMIPVIFRRAATSDVEIMVIPVQ